MCPFWTLVTMGICIRVPQRHNIKQAIGMHVSFMLEIKLPKDAF